MSHTLFSRTAVDFYCIKKTRNSISKSGAANSHAWLDISSSNNYSKRLRRKINVSSLTGKIVIRRRILRFLVGIEVGLIIYMQVIDNDLAPSSGDKPVYLKAVILGRELSYLVE